MNDFKDVVPLLAAVVAATAVILAAVVGATAGIMGNVITQRLQARYAARRKLDEIVAEKRVEACTDAYNLMKRVQSEFTLPITETTLHAALKYFLPDNQEWLLRSRLFLPGNFPDLWFAIWNDIRKAIRMEQESTGSAAYLKQHFLDLIDEAIKEVYSVLGLKIIRPERYQRRKWSLRNRWRRWRASK